MAPDGSAKSANDDPILTISVVVLSLSASNLLLLLVPGTLAIIRWTPVKVDLGVPLLVQPLDLILLAGLLVMQLTLGFFYHYVLPYAGEPLLSQVVSLLLAIVLFVVNFLVLDAELFPYRLFFIGVPLLLVLQKDWVLLRRFRHSDYKPVVERWYRNVRWSVFADSFAATLFLLMFHPTLRYRFLELFFVPPVRMTNAYDIWLPAIFYGLFFFSTLRSLIRNYDYFISVGRRDAEVLSQTLLVERPVVPGVPATLWAIARLTRIYTMIVAGVLSAKVASALGASAPLLAAAALALILGGAFALNDVRDRESDAVNAKTRPIPTGIISIRVALLIATSCFGIALVLALVTRIGGLVLFTVALIALLVVYSYKLKPIPVVKNLVMAVVGVSVPVAGGLAASNLHNHLVWWLAALIGLFTLQKEIAADSYDRKGDEQVGLRTLPILLGDRRAMFIVCGINALLVLTAVTWLTRDRGPAAVLGGIVAVAVLNVAGACVVACKNSGVSRYLLAQKLIQLSGVVVACAI